MLGSPPSPSWVGFEISGLIDPKIGSFEVVVFCEFRSPSLLNSAILVFVAWVLCFFSLSRDEFLSLTIETSASFVASESPGFSRKVQEASTFLRLDLFTVCTLSVEAGSELVRGSSLDIRDDPFTESRKDQKTKRFSNLVFDLRCLICGTYAPHQKSPVTKIPHSAGATTPNLSPFVTVYCKTYIYN
jgi:hypothetical protein